MGQGLRRVVLRKFILCVLAFCLLAFCALVYLWVVTDDVKEKVLVSREHPTVPLEAILVERTAGATVSTSYSVRIRTPGSGGSGSEILLIDNVDYPERIELSWSGKTLLLALPKTRQILRQERTATIGMQEVTIEYSTR